MTPATSLGTRLVVSTICVVPAVLMGLKMDMWFRPLADGQKGDNRLMTLKEIQQIYPQIPDKKGSFLDMVEFLSLTIKSTGISKRILSIPVLLVRLDQERAD
ncbi:hypothetical protein NWO25_15095 [Enterococcus lactis]|nr:hypothetical protein [Enterococcus lactis]